jgi:hypothetical protein
MTLTGRDLRLSQAVARLGAKSASAVVEHRHTASDRDGAVPLGTLALDGVHAAAATSLTLKAADDGPLVGTLPSGLTLTIAGTDYTTTASATAAETTNRITAAITPGLAAEGADDAVVTLGDSVSYAHPKVNVRGVNSAEVSHLMSFGVEASLAAGFPGHLAPAWVNVGDKVDITRKNGTTASKRAASVLQHGWGQVTFFT